MAPISFILSWKAAEHLLLETKSKKRTQVRWWLHHLEFRMASPTARVAGYRCWSRLRHLSNERRRQGSRTIEAGWSFTRYLESGDAGTFVAGHQTCD